MVKKKTMEEDNFTFDLPNPVILENSPAAQYLESITSPIPVTVIVPNARSPSLKVEEEPIDSHSSSETTRNEEVEAFLHCLVSVLRTCSISCAESNASITKKERKTFLSKVPLPLIRSRNTFTAQEKKDFFSTTRRLAESMVSFHRVARSIRLRLRNCELVARGFRLSNRLPPLSTLHRLEYSQKFMKQEKENHESDIDSALRVQLQCPDLRCKLMNELEYCVAVIIEGGDEVKVSKKENVTTDVVPFLEELLQLEKQFKRICIAFFSNVLATAKTSQLNTNDTTRIAPRIMEACANWQPGNLEKFLCDSAISLESATQRLNLAMKQDPDFEAHVEACPDIIGSSETIERVKKSKQAQKASVGFVSSVAELRLQLEEAAANLLMIQETARVLMKRQFWTSTSVEAWSEVQGKMKDLQNEMYEKQDKTFKELFLAANSHIDILCKEERMAASSNFREVLGPSSDDTTVKKKTEGILRNPLKEIVTVSGVWGEEEEKDNEASDGDVDKDFSLKMKKTVEVFQAYTGSAKEKDETQKVRKEIAVPLQMHVFEELKNILGNFPNAMETKIRELGDESSSDEEDNTPNYQGCASATMMNELENVLQNRC
eukprot:g5122.t1